MSALRPSNLPKLAVCPCYESNPVAGPAAERGTLLDSAFRAELLGLEERLIIANKLSADEIAAVILGHLRAALEEIEAVADELAETEELNA